MSREKQIKSTDWLTARYSEEEIAKMKAEAIKEAENELREKQIEEMAHSLCTWWNGKGCTLGSITGKAFPCRFDCNAFTDSKRLYEQGYRKQSEGEWIPIVKCKTSTKTFTYYQCSLCGVYLMSEANYCPNCGAKMKGGAE